MSTLSITNIQGRFKNSLATYFLLLVFCLVISSPAPAPTQEPCVDPPADLVAWWAGDDHAFDLIGDNNGTLMNEATYADGKVASSFSFNGQNAYVNLPDGSSNLLSSNAGTITTWVNPTATGDNDIIVAFGTGNNGEGIGLGIYGNVRVYHHTGIFDWQSSTTVSANEWTFLVYTWDDDYEQIYKNGIFSESRPRGGFAYAPGHGRIGHGFWGDPANAFPGLIDEVEVYNRALSAAEIASIYNAGSAGKCKPCAPQPTQMVAWWKGEDNTEDSIGTHDGTLVNDTTFADGKIGRAFEFENAGDAVHIGTIDNLGVNESEPFSITSWVNYYDASGFSVGQQVIMGNYMGERGGSNGYFSTYVNIDDSTLMFAINKKQINADYVTAPITEGWRFVTATYDGTYLDLYLDGELMGFTTRSFSGSTANTRGWDIGNFSPETNASHEYDSSFFGLIDEVQLFDRALSAEEVADIYAAGSEGVCIPQLSQYSVTADTSGTGTGSVSSDPEGISYSYPDTNTGQADFDDGSSITLTAKADLGSTTSWSGTCTTTGGTEGGDGTATATCTFNSLKGARSATATFTLAQYTVTANAAGSGAGGVSSNPVGINYTYPTFNSGNATFNHGSNVILTATANAGSSASWLGSCMSAGGTEGGNGTATATCTFGSLGGTEAATVTFTLFNVNGPDLNGLFQTITVRKLFTTYHLAGILKVNNIGNRSAGAFKVSYYLSNDGVALGPRLGTSTVRSLTAGASTKLAYGFFMLQSPIGKYLITVIDSDNGIPERDETNNRVTGKIR